MPADAVSGPLRVLGIDPGLGATGYGVVEGNRSAAAALAWGAVRTRPKDGAARRLATIFEAVGKLIEEHQPQELAIEQQFVHHNVRSALSLGEARAAAMIAAAVRDIPVFQYPPATIKEAVTGAGGAPKEQVQAMVVLQLGLSEPPRPLDAADALAIALTRLSEAHFDALLARQA